MKELKNIEEYDLGQIFAKGAVCKGSVGVVAKLEELLSKGSMIEWGKIVSGISDNDLAILAIGMTSKGRHFLLAGLADERLPELVRISKQMECDTSVNAETIAKIILEKWKKI